VRIWQHSTGKILKTLSLPKNMSAGRPAACRQLPASSQVEELTEHLEACNRVLVAQAGRQDACKCMHMLLPNRPGPSCCPPIMFTLQTSPAHCAGASMATPYVEAAVCYPYSCQQCWTALFVSGCCICLCRQHGCAPCAQQGAALWWQEHTRQASEARPGSAVLTVD
jgi:hypothetical protein